MLSGHAGWCMKQSWPTALHSHRLVGNLPLSSLRKSGLPPPNCGQEQIWRRYKARRRHCRGAKQPLTYVTEQASICDAEDVYTSQSTCVMPFSGSSHLAAHAQVKAEVDALHGRKADVMRAATQAQRRELEDICARMHMAVPPLPPTPSPAPHPALSGAALCVQARPTCLLLRWPQWPQLGHMPRLSVQSCSGFSDNYQSSCT